jgi:hypothetical protein
MEPCRVLSLVRSAVTERATRLRLKPFQPDTTRHIQIADAETSNATKNKRTYASISSFFQIHFLVL